MTTDITELAQSHELRNKVNHRLYGALEFHGTSGENATITLSIDECKSIIAALDERLALVEALEKAQAVMNAVVTAAAIRGVRPFDGIDCDPPTLEENAEACGDAMSARIRELEANPPKPHHNGLMQISNELAIAKQRIAELEPRTVTVKPDDADEVREEGNQFLVVRHPGKVPVIKHPVGQLEDYLLQILKADPLATIDIVTHRYYGAGGQFVEDADEYLHEMGIKWEAE